MKVLKTKDSNRRTLYYIFEEKKKYLLSIINNLELPLKLRKKAFNILTQFSKDISISRIRNRCILTNRPRAVYKQFKMSRLMFRKYALQGRLIGVRKSSW